MERPDCGDAFQRFGQPAMGSMGMKETRRECVSADDIVFFKTTERMK